MKPIHATHFRYSFQALSTLALFIAATALCGGTADAKRSIVADDYFSLATVLEVAYSPDGDTLAYVDL